MRPRRDTERARALVDAGILTATNSCAGKVKHSNQNDARHAAKAIERKMDRPATTYRCPFCSHFHVTKLTWDEMQAASE